MEALKKYEVTQVSKIDQRVRIRTSNLETIEVLKGDKDDATTVSSI